VGSKLIVPSFAEASEGAALGGWAGFVLVLFFVLFLFLFLFLLTGTIQSAPDCLEGCETEKCFRSAASLLALSEREQAPGLLADCLAPA
jgi:hypothetical protein